MWTFDKPMASLSAAIYGVLWMAILLPGGDCEGNAFGSVCLSERVTQKLLLRLT